MSLLFAICEKYMDVSKDIRVNIASIIEQKNIDGKIVMYTANPMELLQYSANKFQLTDKNVYVLCSKGEEYSKSLQMAKLIRLNDPSSYIVFLSDTKDFCFEIIKSNAEVFDFLQAPVEYSEIEKSVVSTYKAYQNQLFQSNENDCIFIKEGSYIHKLPIRDIVFVESYEQKLIVHTTNKSIECFGHLKDIIKELNKVNKFFYRCHRSYIVNLKHIEQIDFKNLAIEMSNGCNCYLSRQKKREIKEYININK